MYQTIIKYWQGLHLFIPSPLIVWFLNYSGNEQQTSNWKQHDVKLKTTWRQTETIGYIAEHMLLNDSS